MARYLDVHPDNPQPRLLAQVVDALRDDALIAYPTDSGYALGCQLGNRDGRDRILRIRGLDDKHHFTLVCKDFAQLGQLVHVDNSAFRAIKAATPGPVHVHPAGHPRGAAAADAPEEAHRRRPDPRPHVVQRAARGARRAAADQHPDPARRGRGPDLRLGDQGGARPPGRHRDRGGRDPATPTTVVDLSGGAPEIVRYGAGTRAGSRWPERGWRCEGRAVGPLLGPAPSAASAGLHWPSAPGAGPRARPGRARSRRPARCCGGRARRRRPGRRRPGGGRSRRAGEPEQREDAEHHQRRQHADDEEVAWAARPARGPTQSATKQRSKNRLTRPTSARSRTTTVSASGDPERHDLPAGLAPLFPEGSGMGHATTVGRASLVAGGDAPQLGGRRRSGPRRRPGAGVSRSPSTTASSANRRAATSTRDSRRADRLVVVARRRR